MKSWRIIFFIMMSGCATYPKYYNLHYLSPQDLSQQETIDIGHCTRVAAGAIPMPSVRVYDDYSRTYVISGTVSSYDNYGNRSTGSYNGYMSSTPSPAQSFTTGFANGAAIGAAIKAKRERQAVMDGCMAQLGWTTKEPDFEIISTIEPGHTVNDRAASSVIYESAKEQWADEVTEFFFIFNEYRENERNYKLLDEEVKRLASSNPELGSEKILWQAHSNLTGSGQVVLNNRSEDSLTLVEAYKAAANKNPNAYFALAAYYYGMYNETEVSPGMARRCAYWAKLAYQGGAQQSEILYSIILFHGIGLAPNQDLAYSIIKSFSPPNEFSESVLADFESELGEK